jgi:hypothetical protein
MSSRDHVNTSGAGSARRPRPPRRFRSRHVHRDGRHRVDRRLPNHADDGARISQPMMDQLAFIAIMGGSILVAPLVSEAQQSVKMYRVGVLSSVTPPLRPLDALRQGLSRTRLRGKVAPSGSNGDSPAQPMSV